MKAVPYKCVFGHITIKKFSKDQPTTGTAICEECLKLAESESITNPYYWRGEYISMAVVVNKETIKASRI